MFTPVVTRTVHRHLDLDGVRVFYRESLPERPDAPVLLLLHGFPSGSHQFRRLIDVLGSRYRLVAPDYPGFGHTEAGADFAYSFDRLADVTEGFVQALGLTRFVLYVFDFGAPVGFRLAERHPEWIAGLIVQNGNAYDEGLSPGARDFIALRRETPGAEETIRELLTLAGTRMQYETGVRDPAELAPDGWTLDQHFLDLPGRKEAQLALAFDYHSNVERYDRWQRWLRTHTPPTLITWGVGDPFFPEAGARAYLRDLPAAELHLFDAGHFALETHLPEIAPLVAGFLDRTWSRPGPAPGRSGLVLSRRARSEDGRPADPGSAEPS
jgi:pimeloyl-ACP methyl ester carboxylesterase